MTTACLLLEGVRRLRIRIVLGPRLMLLEKDMVAVALLSSAEAVCVTAVPEVGKSLHQPGKGSSSDMSVCSFVSISSRALKANGRQLNGIMIARVEHVEPKSKHTRRSCSSLRDCHDRAWIDRCRGAVMATRKSKLPASQARNKLYFVGPPEIVEG